MKWYEQLTGIDEIRSAQNRVIEAQGRFAAAQDKRREVTVELNDVKNKIKDLQEELATVSRGEERLAAFLIFLNLFLKRPCVSSNNNFIFQVPHSHYQRT